MITFLWQSFLLKCFSKNDENYENLSTETYIRQLEAINERFGSYRKWNEDYLKYLHNKKVQQQINNENDCNINTSPNREARRKSPRLAPNSVYRSYDPFSSLLSPPFSGNRQFVMPEYSQNNWGRNYCSPRSGFFNWFWNIIKSICQLYLLNPLLNE